MSLKFKTAAYTILLFAAPILSSFGFGQSGNDADRQSRIAEQAWETIVAIEEIVHQNHLSPPTRQQMYMAATQGVYRANRFSMQAELPQLFSEITESEEFGKLFLKAWHEASERENFVAERTLESAASSMLRSAGGTSSRFLSQKEYLVENSLKENQYVGIGIQLGMQDDFPIIHKAFYGGAAQKSGASSNDLILKIDGVSTQGKSLQNTIDALRGPQDSTLDVTLRNTDSQVEREYTMTRSVIPIATIEGLMRNKDGSWKLHRESKPDVAYLKFRSISGSTPTEFGQLMRQVGQENFEKVILDFREIIKGDVHQTVMLADTLIDNQKLGIVASRSEGKSDPGTRPGSLIPETIQVVVLTPQRVDGAIFLLLAKLKNRANVTFVGNKVISSGLASKTIALPNDLGAIIELPYALCVSPDAEPFEMGDFRVPGELSYIGQPRFQINPDIEQNPGDNGLFDKVNEVLSKTTDASH